MNKPIHVCIIILVCIFFTGCVAPQKKPVISMEDKKNRVFKEYYEKALNLENQNELVEAKKNYHLAFAADPSNKDIRQGITQINKRLQSKADKYYQKSITLHKKGQYSEATRYLLIALRVSPEHVKARQALIAGQNLNIKKCIWHTIKKGETLSIISKNFYGNFKQSGIIAQVNNIKNAACIRVGMKLKIPELKEHPFVNQKAAPRLEEWTDASIQPEKKTDTLTLYKDLGIEFFKNKQFENAVIELKKVLNGNPSDKDAIAYISKAYYQLGSNAYTQKKSLAAIEYFQEALTFNNNCSPCKNKITQIQNIYKESHYKAGMKFFDKQNLNSAIFEWNLVHKMDPEYKKVARLLNKAQTIQKNIKALKQSE